MNNSQFITNQHKLLTDVVNNIMPSSENLYFLVGYFYFSGFKEIYQNLEGKHLRILVGMEVERQLMNKVKEFEILNQDNLSKMEIRNEYNKSLVKIFNNSDIFDNEENSKAFKVYIDMLV
jgi:signal recognition particle GTPase